MAKYIIEYTGSFKKDYKRCVKRNLDINLLKQAISLLAETGTLPPEYKSHKLFRKIRRIVGMPYSIRLVANMATR